MKKIIRGLGIAALTVIIGFAMTACGGTGSGADRTLDLPPAGNGLPPAENGLPPAGDGHITFDAPHTFPVFTWAGTLFDDFTGSRIFTHIERFNEETDTSYFLQPSDILAEPTRVEIEAGTLYLQLGTPTTSAPWISMSELVPSGFTVTAGLRIVRISGFISSRNSGIQHSLYWERREYGGDVGLVYADRSGRVSGSFFNDDEGLWELFNWDLRQGWNTVLNTGTAAEAVSVTGRPGSDFWWITW